MVSLVAAIGVYMNALEHHQKDAALTVDQYTRLHLAAFLDAPLSSARLPLKQRSKDRETRQVDQQRFHGVSTGAAHAH